MSQKKGSKSRTSRRLKRMIQQSLPGIKVDPVSAPSREGMVTDYFDGTDPVRRIWRDGDPWWVAIDVCRVLDHGNVTKAILRLDDDEKGLITIQTPGGFQELNVISESGLYSLILTSRKPEAKRFKRWVTHEVLPSIRKTGSYSVDSRVEKFRRKFGMTKLEAEQRHRQVGVHKDVHERMKDEGAKQPDFWKYHIALSEGQFGDGKTPKYWRDRIGIDNNNCHLDHMALHPLTINILAKVETEKKLGALPDSIAPQARIALRTRLGYETARQISHESLERLGPDSHFDVIEHPTRGRIIDVVDASPALDSPQDSFSKG